MIENDTNIRLAEVTAIIDGKVHVTFYGENLQSEKAYKRLGSYEPAVGDIVVMMKQAKTYFILGKITD